MKFAWKICAILFLATLPLAAQTSTPPPKSRRAKTAPVTAADVQALKDAIAAQQSALAAQQQQIQALQNELQRRDQAVQQAQTAATDASSKADAAASQVNQQQQSVSELKSDVTDLKTNVNNTAMSLQETQKNVNTAVESPLALHYKGITITPGGFLAAEFVRRSRALASDVNTPFNSVTMPGASQDRLSEFFGSGRQSRVSMLAEGRLKSAKLSGYVEADFLSAGVTSNNNQSNSYTMRQRQAWGQAAFDNGFSFTGGQMWSLITETKHGVDNRTEALPMTIDAQYTVGFSWARQYGLRIAKNFGNKFWLAAAIENPQATITTHGNASDYLIGSAGNGGGLYNGGASGTCTSTTTSATSGTPPTTTFSTSTSCSNLANYAFNPSPDVIVKAVAEPGFGHYEVFGIYSRFRDRIFPYSSKGVSAIGATNVSTDTGGVGANARWSMFEKHVDFGLHAFAGNGIGRYGTGGISDAAIHPDGTIAPIREYQGLSTLEFHTKRWDVYFNAGAEYGARTAFLDPLATAKNGKTTLVGYGAPTFKNSGCYTETAPGSGGFSPGSLPSSSCTADTRVLIEGTAGFWYRFYTGPKGRFQFGPQYSYVTRNAWSGSGTPNEPHGIDNMVFTSFRYYLP